MVLLYPRNGGQYCLLLNQRSQNVEHHKGEISFPGGAADPQDPTPLHTALRETHEEMGIPPQNITILGEMDQVATRSRFRVSVFAGAIPHPGQFRPSPDEIAEIIEFPLTDLRNPANLRIETRWHPGRPPETTHSYACGPHLIFGATARILQQFLQLLADGLESEDPI